MSKEQKNTIVPKRRFPDFKEGDEWNIEPVGVIYSFKTTNTFSRDNLNYVEGEVKNIHYGDIHTKFSTLFDITKEKVPFINPSISTEKITDDYYCVEGDMIFADASEDLKDVGKSIEIVNLNSEKLLSGLHTLLARQKEPKLVTGFGGYLFMAESTRKQIQRESQGAKVLGISTTRLSNIFIAYPKDKVEQQKIASCLSSLDDLITAHTQKLDALKTHKKVLMQQLSPAEGDKVPKLRFKEFNSGGQWEKKNIGEITAVTTGGTPESKNVKYWNGNIPWMNSGDLNKKRIYSVENRITELGMKESSTRLIPPNCVLIGLAGQGKTRGTAAINYIELCTNQSVASIHPNNNVFIPEFLYQLLDSKYDELRALSTGEGGRGGLNLQIIKSFEIYLPDKDEQQKIASGLSTLDQLINAQAEKIEQMRMHKKGLMQELFPVIKESN